MAPPADAGTLFTYPERMESCVSLGGKEDCTNIQISAEPGIELGNRQVARQRSQQLRQPYMTDLCKMFLLFPGLQLLIS